MNFQKRYTYIYTAVERKCSTACKANDPLIREPKRSRAGCTFKVSAWNESQNLEYSPPIRIGVAVGSEVPKFRKHLSRFKHFNNPANVFILGSSNYVNGVQRVSFVLIDSKCLPLLPITSHTIKYKQFIYFSIFYSFQKT